MSPFSERCKESHFPRDSLNRDFAITVQPTFGTIHWAVLLPTGRISEMLAVKDMSALCHPGGGSTLCKNSLSVVIL
jgi:hypothetical protein